MLPFQLLADCSATVLPAGAAILLEERSFVRYLIVDYIVPEVRTERIIAVKPATPIEWPGPTVPIVSETVERRVIAGHNFASRCRVNPGLEWNPCAATVPEPIRPPPSQVDCSSRQPFADHASPDQRLIRWGQRSESLGISLNAGIDRRATGKKSEKKRHDPEKECTIHSLYQTTTKSQTCYHIDK